jgi:soluble lytic murein transglycosylase
LMWEFHGEMRLVAAAYYAGDKRVGKRLLEYRNPDVVAYVEAVRRHYLRRKSLTNQLQRR